MDKEACICRKCGFEFKATPGEEEPPECPECKSDDREKLELRHHRQDDRASRRIAKKIRRLKVK